MDRLILPAILGLALLASCGDGADADRPPSDTATPAPTAGATPPATSDTPTGARDFEPIDAATGTLSLAASGEHPGSWTFKDVNGSVTEQAGAGSTSTIMQLEAHDDPVHFKIRLLGGSSEIAAGRYTIGAAERGVDATYENSGTYYKSLGKSTGTVELTKVTADRAVGSYDLTLETLTETPKTAKVKGTFDMRVQR
jgi:hypothetical protein